MICIAAGFVKLPHASDRALILYAVPADYEGGGHSVSTRLTPTSMQFSPNTS